MLIIIRGLPGSGKSTFAEALAKDIYNSVVVEADDFFIKDKEYRFNPTMLAQAHEWCQNTVRDYLNEGKHVIVANCFVLNEHINPYRKMAEEVSTFCFIFTMCTQYQSIHNVPEHTIARMRAMWEDCSGEIRWNK
jgi:tRNA uridine 5-carbamoylmethylation protein Kti12